MKEVEIEHNGRIYRLILAKNAIEIKIKMFNRFLNNRIFKFSKLRNCSICNSGIDNIPDNICSKCKDIERLDSRAYDRIISIGDYYPYRRLTALSRASHISKAIMDCKKEILPCKLFGASLGLYISNYYPTLLKFDGIVSIPSYHDPSRSTKFDKENIIARSFHDVTNIPLLRSPLMKTSNTKMKNVTSIDKEIELAKTLYIANKEVSTRNLKGRSILLIDDLVTFNVTINRNAQILKQKFGVSNIVGITAARTYFQ